jgi:hypothetical protein
MSSSMDIGITIAMKNRLITAANLSNRCVSLNVWNGFVKIFGMIVIEIL